MHISLDWIADYVDLSGLDIKDIVRRLTLGTAEVEGTKEIRRSVKDVIVGEVTAIVEKLDDKLTFCSIDCGKKKYTTVCGAPNVRIGLKAPFRCTKETRHSGKPSKGFLCSAAELGMSDWHEIVLECPNDIKNGTPLIDLIPEADTLIEVDNKSLTHRPDLWGHYGFAREFAAIFDRPLKPLPQLDLAAYDKLPKYPLKNEDYENCPAYGCIEFNTKGTVPSPLFIQRRLHALGLRSYNLLVDVTNYVNWELGQPTHAFDAEKLGGIRIAAMQRNEKFQTLDGHTRNLLPEDLLIWGTSEPGAVPPAAGPQAPARGEYRPVALAGIMGGAETEVTESTKKILLESANFKAARIRKTSGRLDLRTDASQRYEKSQPPCNVKTAVARILKLIEDTGAGLQVLSRFTLDGDLADKVRTIELPPGRLEQLAGITLPKENVQKILRSLEFDAHYDSSGTLRVGVPPFRSAKDISIPEDIVEEVLRVYGFDNIPPVMPLQPVRPLFVEKYIKLEHKARRVLAGGHRFLEVHNYGWTNDLWLKTLGYDPGETLVLRNPTSPETSRMRTTLIPNLLALVPKNRPFRDDFRLFELGRVYLPTGKQRECNEKRQLAGVAFRQSGSLEDFYLEIKSAVEDLFDVYGIGGVRFVASEQSSAPWQAADHWVTIMVGDRSVGSLGVIDKRLMHEICPEGGQIVWFDIDLEQFDGELFPTVKFVEPPRFPLSWQDFSLVWSVDAGFDKLESLLDGFRHSLIVKREFLVSYKGKGLEKGTASYSFRFWIGAADHTLSGEEIESFHEQFLAFIAERNIALRT